MLAKTNQESTSGGRVVSAQIYPIARLVDGGRGQLQLISSGGRYVCDRRASAPAGI